MKTRWIYILIIGLLQVGCARIVYNVDFNNLSGDMVEVLNIDKSVSLSLDNGEKRKVLIPGDWILRLRLSGKIYNYDFSTIPQDCFKPEVIGLVIDAELNDDMTLSYENGVLSNTQANQ